MRNTSSFGEWELRVQIPLGRLNGTVADFPNRAKQKCGHAVLHRQGTDSILLLRHDPDPVPILRRVGSELPAALNVKASEAVIQA